MSLGGNSKTIRAIPVGLALGRSSRTMNAETPRSLGFRFDNFWPALRLLLAPTIVAGAVVVLGSWWARGSDFAIAPLRWRFLTLPLWALFQQYALQGFIHTRAQLHFGKGAKSILLVGAVFSLLHFPIPF